MAPSSSPLDWLEAARDLIRKDELERMHHELLDMYKQWQELPDDTFGETEEGKAQRLQGLDWAMNILDERIGHLHDRWRM